MLQIIIIIMFKLFKKLDEPKKLLLNSGTNWIYIPSSGLQSNTAHISNKTNESFKSISKLIFLKITLSFQSQIR